MEGNRSGFEASAGAAAGLAGTEPSGSGAGASGYFGPDSMLRRINGERALVLSGPRALLMQAAHPLAVAGLLAHTGSLEEPYERLKRVAEVLSIIGYGTREEADEVTAKVRAMHRTVRGELSAAAGPFPAGTPYRADDPELLLWILFTLVDSGTVVYERFVADLDEEERAAYWSDYRVIGRLFGLRDSEMPATLADLRDYRREMLEGDRLVVTDWSRSRAREIVLDPPAPLLARPMVEVMNFVTIALLPDPIRRQYGFAPLPTPLARRTIVAAGAEYVKRVVIPLLPDGLRLVPQARAAQAA